MSINHDWQYEKKNSFNLILHDESDILVDITPEAIIVVKERAEMEALFIVWIEQI